MSKSDLVPRRLSWDGSSKTTSTTKQWNHAGNLATDITEEVDGHIHWKTSDGYAIKNFHKRKKAGELLPLTQWHQQELVWDDSFGYTLQYTPTAWKMIVTGARSPIEAPGYANAKLKQYDNSYFVQAAASKIYSSGWDALTFIAEIHKTKRMITDFLLNLKRNVGSKNWANAWLEGRYGWRVLYYDMIEIEKAITSIDDRRKRFRESVGTTIKETEVQTQTSSLGGAGSVRFEVTDTYEIGLRGTVVADIEPPKIAFNPITTGWELITFSFVIDWVVNVGQWLESMSFLVFSKEHYAAGGHLIRIYRDVEVLEVTPEPDWSIQVDNLSTNGTFSLTERLPQPVSTNPLLQIRLDTIKSIDLIALAYQAGEKLLGKDGPRRKARRK